MNTLRLQLPIDDDVTLEAEYRERADAPGVALILHPHPTYGGNMDNNVVQALADGAEAAGWSWLRFNFRGVGGSTGSHGGGYGEAADTVAVAQWLLQRQRCPLALLGYSFGSLVGSLAATQMDPVDRALWVAPPLVIGNLSDWPEQAGPLWIVAGSQDEYTAVGGLQAYINELGARGHFKLVSGVDHFWWGMESVLSGMTADLLLGRRPE